VVCRRRESAELPRGGERGERGLGLGLEEICSPHPSPLTPHPSPLTPQPSREACLNYQYAEQVKQAYEYAEVVHGSKWKRGCRRKQVEARRGCRRKHAEALPRTEKLLEQKRA